MWNTRSARESASVALSAEWERHTENMFNKNQKPVRKKLSNFWPPVCLLVQNEAGYCSPIYYLH